MPCKFPIMNRASVATVSILSTTLLLTYVRTDYVNWTNTCVFKATNSLDCSAQKLTDVPSDNIPHDIITSLDLSHNEIRIIKNGTFHPFRRLTVLDLSYNDISVIKTNAFAALENLRILDISHNNLRIPTSFPSGIFKPLQALEILKMQGTSNGGAYPDDALKDLINLKELYIQGTSQHFGPGFTNLVNLKILYLSPPSCNVNRIQNDTFWNLRFSPLEELSFQRCSIGHLDENAFIYFPGLRTLNVVCNYDLGIKRVLNAISNIQGKPLETLVLDDIDRTKGDYKYFNKTTVCSNDFPNLKRLSIRNDAIDSVSLDVLSCMPSLQVLNIGFNALTLTWAPWHIFRSSTKEHWLNSNITELDMSYGFNTLQTTFKPLYCPERQLLTDEYFRNPEYPSDDDLADVTTSTPIIPSLLDRFLDINFNPKLQALHIDHIHFAFTAGQFEFAFATGYFSSPSCQLNLPKNDVRFINASFNQFGDVNCHVTGLDHLQILDLSHSGLKTVNQGTLKSAPNLKTLYLSGNELGTNTSHWETALHFLPRLETLTVSSNKIKELPPETFLKTKSLKYIDLSKNSLSELKFTLKNLSVIETLDVSDNLLSTIHEPFLYELKQRPSINKTLTVDMTGNPSVCDCEAINFLEFLKEASDYNIIFNDLNDYYCSKDGIQVQLIEIDVGALEESCKETDYNIIIIANLVALIVILIIVAILIYNCRWKIAWKVYEVRRVMRQAKRTRSFKRTVHKYKLFVAYDPMDDVGLPWMYHELLPTVEHEWEMTAFIMDRDSLVGPFLEEVTEGIKHSEKKLFVVTEDFLRRYQWPMVLHWCVDGGLSSFIVVLIDMKVRNLPPSLAKVAMTMEKKYPSHVLCYKSGQDNREVWSNLKIALDEPRRKSTRVSVI